ncbi:MAG: TetR/AcrR family transcriptional regulator [Clostridiales bacterium]|nr:TetR/AcrR family transcriptional regulator [Clostridiales bacterium]
MGRKTTVTKEMILEAAFQILEEEGYGAVNIKTIAAKVGCSTQPISWHFGNMQQMRKSLCEYCIAKMWGGLDKEMMGEPDPAGLFFMTGKNYLSIAYDHSNVFKFLHIDAAGDMVDGKPDLISALGDPRIVKMFSAAYKISEKEIAPVIRDIIIYTHGLSTIVVQGVFDIRKEEAFAMIYNEGRQRFKAIGIDIGEMK